MRTGLRYSIMLAFSSFKRVIEHSAYCHRHNLTIFSIASHQPRGVNYVDLRCLAPIDRQGRDIRMGREVDLSTPKGYLESLTRIRQILNDAFMSRLDEIGHWTSTLDKNAPTILCSWAPYSAASKNQIKAFNMFACHSSVVAEMISMLRPDIKIIMDKDRSVGMVNLSAADDRCLLEGLKNSALIQENI